MVNVVFIMSAVVGPHVLMLSFILMYLYPWPTDGTKSLSIWDEWVV